MRHNVRRSLLLLVGLLAISVCLAERVQVPLDMDHRFLESLVREQVFTGPDDTVRINDDGSGCQFLELREPRITTGSDRVRLRTSARARAGRRVGSRCLLILSWRGQLELEQRPAVSPDRRSVLLNTESWRVLTPDGRTDTAATTIGRWVEQFLPLKLKQTRIDLEPPLRELQEILALVVVPENAAQVNALLDSVAIDRVSAHDDKLTLTVGLMAPADRPPLAVEPELTDTELAQLDLRLQAVDAFVTSIVRHLAADPAAADHLEALFDVLLNSRRELVAILSERRRQDRDPVRKLFVDTWNQLTPTLAAMAAQQDDNASAARYLSFIAAGDMLRVLDAAGPAAGLDLSSDGLRRLARTLVPDDPRDPLQYDEAVDLELRRSLGFGEPLPPPQDTAATSWLDWWIRPALAAAALDAAKVKKLNNWVPKYADMDVYLPMVRDVLRHVTAEQLRATKIDAAFHDVFRHLVLTTAWQESCWRQFMVEKDKRVPLRSGTGDIGMMQINPRVWRGFYDQHGLKWDIVYNARAGADILANLMNKYAVRNREHKQSGGVDNLARSTYAAYNGGPRQYDRYRRGGGSEHGRKVDRLFWEKYRITKTGKDLAVKSCFKE